MRKQRFWLYRRGGIYYIHDSETGARESLQTRDKQQAEQIRATRNMTVERPVIGMSLAKAYLTSQDPKLLERTWAFVMQEFCSVKKESTRLRRERAVRSKAFNFIRNKRLVETAAEDFHAVLKAGGVYTNQMLRCIHNLALGMGWVLAPIIPQKLWPVVEKKHKRAVTFEEHEKIIAAENGNKERKAYYELLWEIGSAQTDGASLTTANVDWKNRLLSYRRRKTGELCVLEIGSRLESLLKSLPSEGPLFPRISTLKDKDRAAEFRRRCRLLGIEGISLHSYRYAWAWRAKRAGMPERFAQSALGHGSRAVTREYARDGVAICPSLENYENKIVQLNSAKVGSAKRTESTAQAVNV